MRRRAPGEPVTVRCLSTGVVRPKRDSRGVRRYLPGGWDGETLPVHFFLVEHPAGLCIFDVGQTARAARPGYLPRWHPFLRLARFELGQADEAAEQLQRLGHEVGEVRWVVLSHLHTDHVGGLEPFARAEVIVSRCEWQRAGGFGGRIRGYLPQHWPREIAPRVVDLEDAPLGPFSGSLDLAGDGRMTVVPTPGHTPGHLGLLIRNGEGGWLLGGDLAHSRAGFEESSPALAGFCRRHGVVPLMSHDPMAPALAGGGHR